MATATSRPFWVSCLLLSLVLAPFAQATDAVYISGTSIDGVTRQLAVDRTPALFTKDFGDCLGGESLFNVTKFDAAYYSDNSTVLFHLDGTSSIKNESLMMYISMDAYGENRFQMTFDPCFVNIYSLCPLNASVPVTAWAYFQVGPQQVGDIPELAFTIPDFEGYVRLQIFANSSRTEIGCFQAVMSNGVSIGHPEAISPVLAVFTLVSILASFVTAAYGISIPHMRTHYAHSISALVIFETFQSIFFSGALSVDWPSILVAWWSNFAWSAGQIYSRSMVSSVDSFTGVSGNASQVGGAGSTVINNGGGLAQQIYGRSLIEKPAAQVARRSAYNASDPYDYTWNGGPVNPGMPLPGSWTGFPGTLSGVRIPAADAFTVGLIWLLVALGILALSIVAFKFTLEALAKMKRIKEDRLAYFRTQWVNYAVLAILRTLYMSFFLMVTLTLYQLSIQTSAGATALGTIVFILYLAGVGGVVTYACRFRLRYGRYTVQPDRILLKRSVLFKVVPWIVPIRSSTLKERELPQMPRGSLPFIRIHFIDDDSSRSSVHQDQPYVKRFGWLSARYRRTRWWFFACYILYQLFRAAFIGGASQNPQAQVYGLLVYDIVAFLVVVKINPFEGRRNTALAVWMLGLVKIVSTGLSVAFLPEMNLDRIAATVIGIIIIIAQGLLVIGLMILVVLGAVSSWMSLTRNREDFSPESLDIVRVRYFEYLIKKAPDGAKEKKPKNAKGKGPEADDSLQKAQGPHFNVKSVLRAPKIEDEDDDVLADLDSTHVDSAGFDPTRIRTRASRTNSVSSRMSTHSLPRATRAHRTSWSSRDFAEWDAMSQQRPESSLARRLSSHSRNLLSNSASKTASSANTTAPLTINTEPSVANLHSGKVSPPRTTPEAATPTIARPVSPIVETPTHGNSSGDTRPSTARPASAISPIVELPIGEQSPEQIQKPPAEGSNQNTASS